MDLPKHEYHDLQCYWTWMGKDGIVRTKVKPGSEIEIEQAEENSIVVNSFEVRGKYPIIVDTTDIKSITKEARDFFSIRNRESNVMAIAIIRNSIIGNMVANFFIGLNKPVVPVKLFENEENAINWCLKLKKENDVVK